jgi:hypothetical protein
LIDADGGTEMRFLSRLSIIILMLLILSTTRVFASADYAEQVRTIVVFYELLTGESEPTVANFNAILGRDNEAELELILKQKFPEVDWKGKWDANKEALDYVKQIDANPEQYESRFLKCLRSSEPRLFSNRAKRQIEFPPRILEDPEKHVHFVEFKVLTKGKAVIFQFVPEDKTIENVYLPDGKSIYTLMERCDDFK